MPYILHGKTDAMPGRMLVESRDGMIPYWSRIVVKTPRGAFWARVVGAYDPETGRYPVKLELKGGLLGASQWVPESMILKQESPRVFAVPRTLN